MATGYSRGANIKGKSLLENARRGERVRTGLQNAPLRENGLRTLIRFKYPNTRGQSSIVTVSCASVPPSLTLKQTRQQVLRSSQRFGCHFCVKPSPLTYWDLVGVDLEVLGLGLDNFYKSPEPEGLDLKLISYLNELAFVQIIHSILFPFLSPQPQQVHVNLTLVCTVH